MNATQVESIGTCFKVKVRGQGRVVLPRALRQRRGWADGAELMVLDTADGVMIVTEDELERVVQSRFRQEASVVDELLADRRRQAEVDRA
ncbi:MAG: AbrB/MazE/SpoVT family DNA-binding domain-containing protein [Bifidobacteriaceae bacterium]|jgi:AbrB family looped-hinge helix DNA binding protein|nr:AbrB/MazE/SpoVT family DNA-binding domain-containing protein [Bifidobacteriaceae bacterium]